jgi:hypothetical protein
MPSASERCSSDAARPTMARITPNPVPAMPKPDEDFENLVLAGRDREGRQHQAGGIEHRAQHDRAAVAEPFGDGAEDRLADAPGEVLDRDGEAEFRPEPAEFLGDRDLEQAEARPDRHAQKEDEGAADEDRGEE